MYEFWYHYIKPKYDEREKLCYMDTDSFITQTKTEDIYRNISEDVEKRFDTSKINRRLPIRKKFKKELIEVMKDELGG